MRGFKLNFVGILSVCLEAQEDHRMGDYEHEMREANTLAYNYLSKMQSRKKLIPILDKAKRRDGIWLALIESASIKSEALTNKKFESSTDSAIK